MPPQPSRVPHNPFTATTTSTSLRNQPSQSSLRPPASAASTSTSRTRQNRDHLFAPSLSRRPNSRTRVEDEVLADSSSEHESRKQIRQPNRSKHSDRSPAARHKSKQVAPAESQEFVKRDAQGNYLLGIGDTAPMVALSQEDEDQVRIDEDNAYYSGLAKKFFTSGAGIGTRRVEEDYERHRPDMMAYLKAEVMQKLESERWLYEPVDALQHGTV